MSFALAGDLFSRSGPVIACAHAAAGALVGAAHLRSLRSSVNAFAGGSGFRIVGVMLVRMALLAGILGLAAVEGAVPLLAFALGLLVSRRLTMRRFRLKLAPS